MSRKEDEEMAVWHPDHWETEVRRIANKNFWLGVIGGGPIWIAVTVLAMMGLAVYSGY